MPPCSLPVSTPILSESPLSLRQSPSESYLGLWAIRFHHPILHVLAKMARKVLQRAALAVLQADENRELPVKV
jgi:hypothetical protein